MKIEEAIGLYQGLLAGMQQRAQELALAEKTPVWQMESIAARAAAYKLFLSTLENLEV